MNEIKHRTEYEPIKDVSYPTIIGKLCVYCILEEIDLFIANLICKFISDYSYIYTWGHFYKQG